MSNWPDIVANWAVLETLHGLKTSGIIKVLEESEPLTAQEVSKKAGTAPRETEAALLFVSLILPDVLHRRNDTYQLSDVYEKDFVQNSLEFTRSYAPVVHALGPLLTNEKTYGVDVVRDHQALAISSEIYIRELVLDLVPLIAQDKGEVLVDIGCGSGFIVRRLSEIFNMYGVGIDFSVPPSSEKVLFIKGGLEEVDAWHSHIPKGRTILVASMVLHELLITEGAIKDFFQKYKSAFPGAVLYLVEFNSLSVEELTSLPSDFMKLSALYQFMHPLSKQGMPVNVQAWEGIFKACGVNHVSTSYTKYNNIILKVIL